MPLGNKRVAPDAIIDRHGRLQQVDPSTEGKELRWKLEGHKKFAPEFFYMLSEEEEPDTLTQREKEYYHRYVVVVPSEIMFRRKLDHPMIVGTHWSDESDFELVPWKTIKEQFGAHLVLDPKSKGGVCVVCTREPVHQWLEYLDNFPSSADMAAEVQADYLNSVLDNVSPYVLVSEDKKLEGGWRCKSLLEAMHIMLFLDLTSDNAIKKCQSRGCPNYFRIGSQSKSKYCSDRCASRASTRMGRGQEP